MVEVLHGLMARVLTLPNIGLLPHTGLVALSRHINSIGRPTCIATETAGHYMHMQLLVQARQYGS